MARRSSLSRDGHARTPVALQTRPAQARSDAPALPDLRDPEVLADPTALTRRLWGRLILKVGRQRPQEI